jgi:hypothetical protein
MLPVQICTCINQITNIWSIYYMSCRKMTLIRILFRTDILPFTGPYISKFITKLWFFECKNITTLIKIHVKGHEELSSQASKTQTSLGWAPPPITICFQRHCFTLTGCGVDKTGHAFVSFVSWYNGWYIIYPASRWDIIGLKYHLKNVNNINIIFSYIA